MNYEVDAQTTIYAAQLSDDVIKAELLKHRNPAKGIHVEWRDRDVEGNHRVRIIAPNERIFVQIKNRLWQIAADNFK